MPHIEASSIRPIGNILDIYVRQTSVLSVKMSRTSTESVLTVETSELVTGTHDLIIESYDRNSKIGSALKIDTI